MEKKKLKELKTLLQEYFGISSHKPTKTKKDMKNKKVPRNRIFGGISHAIYKRCSWEPPENKLTEDEELDKRRQFAIYNGASEKAVNVLDQLCDEYEKTFFKIRE